MLKIFHINSYDPHKTYAYPFHYYDVNAYGMRHKRYLPYRK